MYYFEEDPFILKRKEDAKYKPKQLLGGFLREPIDKYLHMEGGNNSKDVNNAYKMGAVDTLENVVSINLPQYHPKTPVKDLQAEWEKLFQRDYETVIESLSGTPFSSTPGSPTKGRVSYPASPIKGTIPSYPTTGTPTKHFKSIIPTLLPDIDPTGIIGPHETPKEETGTRGYKIKHTKTGEEFTVPYIVHPTSPDNLYTQLNKRGAGIKVSKKQFGTSLYKSWTKAHKSGNVYQNYKDWTIHKL